MTPTFLLRMDGHSAEAPPSLVVIANPAAGRGRMRAMLPRLRRALDAHGPHTLHLTTRPGVETSLAHEAAHAGAATILAVGGDGTWGNVARGILSSGRSPRLALLAGGTGNDLAYATALPAHDLEAAVRIATGRGERRIDVGEADGIAFLNCVGFGFDAEVVRRTREVRWLRGHAVYLLTAARQLLRYRGFTAAVTVRPETFDADATLPESPAGDRHLAIIIANGPRFGGGFLIAPGARLDDGVLEVVRIADGAPSRRVAVFADALRGRHERHREVQRSGASALVLTFDVPPYFQADGELHRARSERVEVRCLPGALRLAVADDAG